MQPASPSPATSRHPCHPPLYYALSSACSAPYTRFESRSSATSSTACITSGSDTFRGDGVSILFRDLAHNHYFNTHSTVCSKDNLGEESPMLSAGWRNTHGHHNALRGELDAEARGRRFHTIRENVPGYECSCVSSANVRIARERFWILALCILAETIPYTPVTRRLSVTPWATVSLRTSPYCH